MAWTKFEDIEAWQKARVLNQMIWDAISTGRFGRDYALADQINRAAGLTMDNIAEGFDGGSNAEFAKFLTYSQRSCSEVRSQLYQAIDRGHLDEPTFERLFDFAGEIHRQIGGIIKHLRKGVRVQNIGNTNGSIHG